MTGEKMAKAEPDDFEALRTRSGWPTPMHMHRIADWLDTVTLPARYGDVLRWVADRCDDDLLARPPRVPESAA